MTPKGTTLILSLIVLAVAVAPPAATADGYESVNAIAGPGESNDDGYNSVSALAGSTSGRGQSSEPMAAVTSSPTSILGAAGQPESGPQLVKVDDNGGLSWSDVGIGALVGAGLLVTALTGAGLVARHRRTTAESRA